MRVLHLIHDYHPAIGGSERIVQRVSEELSARGHEVHVVCSNATGPQDFVYGAPHPLPAEASDIGGVTVHRLPYRRWPGAVRRVQDALAVTWWQRRWPGYGRIKSAWAGPWLPGVERVIEGIQPHLVLAGTLPFEHLYVADRTSRRLGIPWIALPCLHSDDAWLMDNPSAFRLLDRASRVFVLTPYEAALLRALGVEAPLEVLGGGVDLPPDVPATGRQESGGLERGDDPVVLFFGRLEEGKGLPAVVRAARHLLSHRDMDVILAGGSTRYANSGLVDLIEATREHLPPSRRHRIHVLRDVSEAEKWRLMSAATVLVQPSRVDSFGLVLLEAWACGKPVVAARTGAQASLVRDGIDGKLVDPEGLADSKTDSSGELERVLDELLDDPAAARRMGEAGRERVEQEWTWRRLVDRVETTYRSVLAPCRRTPVDVGADAARVVAVVVTRNHRSTIEATLESLASSQPPPDQVVVIDHGSTDGTPALVRRRFPQFTVLGFLDNPGFGEGNLRGFRQAGGSFGEPRPGTGTDAPHLLLLNPDATLAPDALARLLDELDRHPECGAVVPKIRMGWQPQILNSAGLCMNQVGYGWDRGYLELDRGQWDEPGPVIGGSGCALLVRGEAFAAVGGFDERYHLYYEDLDLALRLWRQGFEVRYRPDAVAFHFTRASGRSEQLSEGLDHRNRLMTLIKDLPLLWLLKRAHRLLGFELRSVVGALRSGRLSSARLRVGAWWWNLRHLAGTLRRRRALTSPVWGEQIESLLSPDLGAPSIPAPVPDYREVFAHDLAAVGPELSFGTSVEASQGGALGLGWHSLELDGEIPFRWTCTYGVFFLGAQLLDTESLPSESLPSESLGQGRHPTHLEIDWHAATTTEVEIFVDRRLAATTRVEPGPFTLATIPLGQASKCRRSGIFEIELRVQNVLVPSTASRSRDSRTLGVAVRSARLIGAWKASS